MPPRGFLFVVRRTRPAETQQRRGLFEVLSLLRIEMADLLQQALRRSTKRGRHSRLEPGRIQWPIARSRPLHFSFCVLASMCIRRDPSLTGDRCPGSHICSCPRAVRLCHWSTWHVAVPRSIRRRHGRAATARILFFLHGPYNRVRWSSISHFHESGRADAYLRRR